MEKQYVVGIELGSTRIKSVLIDASAAVVAQGSFEWKSTLCDGLWSYALEEVHQGLRASFADLRRDYLEKTGEELCCVSAIGISAMMHGYLAFDSEDKLLVPFRTWQNTNTAAAAKELSALLDFNMPQRWSVSHYYQAVLDGEPHVKKVAFLTTLAGYVHYRLTGRRVLGVGDASGMFPIRGGAYDARMLALVDERLREKGIDTPLSGLLPKIMMAGENAGTLTPDGALLLDPTGHLQSGCVLCPPEGDAGTGMIATCSVAPRTANVSAGTSAFLMAVLEKELSRPYEEIDVVATPMGAPVAMIHVNNFTVELNAWASLFAEVLSLAGAQMPKGRLLDSLFAASATGAADCGGLVGYNFLAGEPIAGVPLGVPLIMRAPQGELTLGSFMKMQLYSAVGSLALGMKILKKEQVVLDSVCGHGGFFKAGRISQSVMSAAIGAPVTVMKNAGEGGAWGIALLALMSTVGETDATAFLARLLADEGRVTVAADCREQRELAAFLEHYQRGLDVVRLAAEEIRK